MDSSACLLVTSNELDRARLELARKDRRASLLLSRTSRLRFAVDLDALAAGKRGRDWQNLFLEFAAFGLVSDDPVYAEKFLWAAKALAGCPEAESRYANEVNVAFYLIGLAAGLNAFCSFLSPAMRELIEDMIIGLAESLYNRRHEPWGEFSRKRNAWNHSVLGYAALGIAGLTVKHGRASEWRRLALDKTLAFFQDGVTEAGLTREGLTYAGFVFRNLGIFLRMSRNAGLFDYALEANAFLERLRRVPDWYRAAIFPSGGWLENFNDSYWDPHPALKGFTMTFNDIAPAQTAAVWNRTLGDSGLATYGITRLLRNSSIFESVLFPSFDLPEPSPGDLFCRDVGHVVAQSCFGPDNRVSITCGEYIGGIHDQADNGQFTLFFDGIPVAIDNGLTPEPKAEGAARSTSGHNLILVDGKGQCPTTGGVSARITRFEDHPTTLIVETDLARSYASCGYNSLRRARRTFVWFKSLPGLIVVDHFQKNEEAAQYALLIHTPPMQITETLSDRLVGSIIFDRKSTELGVVFSTPPDAVKVRSFVSGSHPMAKHPVWEVQWSTVELSVASFFAPSRFIHDAAVGLTTGDKMLQARLKVVGHDTLKNDIRR